MQMTMWGTALQADIPGLHTAHARRVKEAIEWFARRTGECWARIETIAARADVGVRTAQTWVGAFVRWGWLKVLRRGGKRSALRAVSFPKQARCATPSPVTCAVKCASGPRQAICIEKRKEVKTPWCDGVSAEPRAPERQPTPALKPGSLPHVDRQTLTDPHRLGALLGRFARAHNPARADACVRDPRTLLRWFGLARRALRVGRSPGALFRSLLAGRRWDWISQDDEDGARRDVAEFLGYESRRRQATTEAEILAEVQGVQDA